MRAIKVPGRCQGSVGGTFDRVEGVFGSRVAFACAAAVFFFCRAARSRVRRGLRGRIVGAPIGVGYDLEGRPACC
eukprot:11219215-Lingulodinium_polyedra.AAC.1